ncbi:MAG: hypothetical protein J7K40_01505 [candidate division Zixibacteria bacterium]|nr:hypothetical protein [candidate division Zixibacteria bacterium]
MIKELFWQNKLKAILIFGAVLLFVNINQIYACDIKFSVQGEQKELYEVGDEVILTLIVKYTHRVCPEGIDKTQYETNGIKILQGTKWKEFKPGLWGRKLKVEVTGNKEGKISVAAIRTCEKEGGFGSITLEAKPIVEPEKVETPKDIKKSDSSDKTNET